MTVVLLLVLLAVGAGVAYLVIAVRRANEVRGELSRQVFGFGSDLGSRLSLARAERDQLRDHVDRLDAALGELRDLLAQIVADQQQSDDRAAGEIAAVARQVEEVAGGQEDIRGYFRSTLADQALAGAGDHQRQIVTASVCSAQSADLLHGLAAKLCDAIGLESIFPERLSRLDAVTYYTTRTPAGQPLADTLAALLAEVPDETRSPSLELEELRRLLIVLRAEGPGIVQVGPLILASTPSALLGCVTSPEAPGRVWAGRRDLANSRDRTARTHPGSFARTTASSDPEALSSAASHPGLPPAPEEARSWEGAPAPRKDLEAAPPRLADPVSLSPETLAAECAAWMQALEPGRVTDLTAWAAGYLS